MTTELDDETARGRVHQPRGLAALLAVGGLIGLIASFVLTLDKLELLKNPDFIPACDLGSIVSCSNVMKSDQATIFAFMNPLPALWPSGRPGAPASRVHSGPTSTRWPTWCRPGLPSAL